MIVSLGEHETRMNQILRCDWLPERATRSFLARSGLPAVFREKNSSESRHTINPLLTKLVRSRWLDIGLVLFGVFIVLGLVQISILKHAKID